MTKSLVLAWFVVKITDEEFLNVQPDGDVEEIYRVHIDDVFDKLTHSCWKTHWETVLRREVENFIELGSGEYKA